MTGILAHRKMVTGELKPDTLRYLGVIRVNNM